MRLPRLRVSQLIYLVVYAALIGSADLNGTYQRDARIIDVASGMSGMVWVRMEDVTTDARAHAIASVSVEIPGRRFPENYPWFWCSLGEVEAAYPAGGWFVNWEPGEYLLIPEVMLE